MLTSRILSVYRAFEVLFLVERTNYFRVDEERWRGNPHRTLQLSSGRIEEMPKDSLRELCIEELKDLYNAETQLVKALPKMAKAASNNQLRQAFEEHLRQTSEQVSRLEQIFEALE